ncbi:MAG: Deoxyribodipyrimidine photolyase-like protein [Promethearchaeota archaeon]|nr:MAG: Deoxyribodipyrimidine photolyase-like protein [Candidatus Lokiarchaeota archaeon]
MKEAVIIFPHQLFETHPAIKQKREVFLIEDSLFFKDKKYPTNFHKKKLILHRASLQAYKDTLISNGARVNYLKYTSLEDQDNDVGSFNFLFKQLNNHKIQKIHVADPVDWALEKRLNLLSNSNEIELIIHDSPAFLCNREYLMEFFGKTDNYLQTSFYIEQRRRLDILMRDEKPMGGKWSFDAENRKTIPKKLEIPDIPDIYTDSIKYVVEAQAYIEDLFPENPGEGENFFYPIDHESAWKWFQIFLKERFKNFGPYEDAIKKDEILLFHSLLSPLLNVGFLTPEKVVEEVISYSEDHDIPINSLEGFIRQIIGWREFMRAVYLLEGTRQRNSNHFKHSYSLPDAFYTAQTKIDPIDDVIKKVLNNGYLHHIERLMLLGNFMTLCEIHPNEIYKWFMELFIDAYDWVMVPNVYGMSSYADGGLITTKPYVSSSNYVRKMSDYPQGDWCEVWDALYWRFIHKHKDSFEHNPRMSLMVSILNKKDESQLKELLETAETYLEQLHNKQ